MEPEVYIILESVFRKNKRNIYYLCIIHRKRGTVHLRGPGDYAPLAPQSPASAQGCRWQAKPWVAFPFCSHLALRKCKITVSLHLKKAVSSQGPRGPIINVKLIIG